MKLIYVWDALCGWCYGFGAVLSPFLAQHPDLKVEIISGGLFIGEHSRPIGHYPHIAGANKRITDMYGVPFGPAYERLLQTGTLVLDSYRPSLALNVFKALTQEKEHILIAKAIQEAFYLCGRSLSDLDTYLGIAKDYNLDTAVVSERISVAWSNPEEGMMEDFTQVRALGVDSFPTLFLESDGRYYSFGGAMTTLASLEARYSELQASLQ